MKRRGTKYDLPDQVWDILNVPGGWGDTKVSIFRHSNEDCSHSDENFRNSSTQIIRYYGGEANVLKEGLKKWQPTVLKNPYLCSGELVPVSDFIDDPEKREAMEEAVGIHLNKAHLRELERLLAAAITYSGARTKVNSLMMRVQSALKATKPNQEEIETLSKEVEYDFKVPTWFSDDLQLCLSFYSTGEKQCSSQSGKGQLCATPGQMTEYLKDGTNEGAGGCKLRWGLFSKRYTQPLWFNSVKICFRWNGTDAKSCGGRTNGSFCAGFGNYTDYYLDNTGWRYLKGPMCSMSWKLHVPNTAPEWLLHTKLCFGAFERAGDGDRCTDSGLPASFCSMANAWTPYYNDGTMSYAKRIVWNHMHIFTQYCRVRWGIFLP